MKNRFSLSLGFLLIAIALVSLLSAMGGFNSDLSSLLISWPFLLVVLGVVNLICRHWLGALVLMLLGSYFMFPRVCAYFEMEPLYDSKTMMMIFFSVMLLVVGFWMIFYKKAAFAFRRFHNSGGRRHFWSSRHSGYESNGLPIIDCVFGDVSHTAIEQPFKGAQISVVFGGAKLDLQKTVLQEGDTIIDLACVFGGVQIIVPPHFTVFTQVTPIFGGITDKRNSTPSPQSACRLIIQGDVVFGGVEIFNGVEEPLESIEEDVELEVLESVSVKQNNMVHIIPVEEIQYIQSDGDYVTICTTQGKFLKDQTMKYFQKSLPSERFLRIHRSYIVNYSEISSIDTKGKETYFVILKDGTSLRASAGGYQILKQKLGL